MHAEQSTPTGRVMLGSVQIANRDDIGQKPAWQRSFAPLRKDHRYYEIVEDTLDQGFRHGYFVLSDSAGNETAVQPFFLLDQDMLQGAGPVIRWTAAQVRRLFPRFLFMRTLMVGCAAGEGHLDTARQDRAA